MQQKFQVKIFPKFEYLIRKPLEHVYLEFLEGNCKFTETWHYKKCYRFYDFPFPQI